MRVGVALSDFPRLWPTPPPGEIRLEYDPTRPPRLLLPRTPAQSEVSTPEFAPLGPDLHSPFELETSQTWRVSRELIRQTAALENRSKSRLRDGGTVRYSHEYTASVSTTSPADAAIDVHSEVEIQRASSAVIVKTASVFTRTSVSIQATIERDGR